MQACRDTLRGLVAGQNAGLLLSRYLQIGVQDKKKHPDSRRDLFKAAADASASSTGIYRFAYERWQRFFLGVSQKELHVNGRMIVGLGGENVLETGITLHHTYGVPYIPGSALKGLAAHYADQVWGSANDRWKKTGGESHMTIFGAQDDAGHILFHDAWITPNSLKAGGPSGLVLDVMTPHHGDYYGGKTYQGGEKERELIPPTDFDDPNPVTFLSVTGSFLVAVSCDDSSDEGKKWADLALKLVCAALQDWGIGGKTSSGYGRLLENKPVLSADNAPAQAAASSLKRPFGTPVRVKVIGPKGEGFRVQEAGHKEGSLTVGPRPQPLPEVGAEIEVEVHNDDQNNPQYRWPTPRKLDKAKKHTLGK